MVVLALDDPEGAHSVLPDGVLLGLGSDLQRGYQPLVVLDSLAYGLVESQGPQAGGSGGLFLGVVVLQHPQEDGQRARIQHLHREGTGCDRQCLGLPTVKVASCRAIN